MVAGIGSDVVEHHRIQQAIERYGLKFAERVLSPEERNLYDTYPMLRRVEFLAGRFAAKEAMSKASGLGLGKISMHQVELLVGENGLSVRFLHDSTPVALAGNWHVSITHTSSIAFAVALREIIHGDGQFSNARVDE